MRLPWLRQLFPFLHWWPRVNRGTLRADATAGLTGGLILVPQGVAFAAIAGMPPEYGLYAAMLPAIVAALWGSSWHLVSGPTTAISIVVYATISPLAHVGTPEYVGLVLTLTLLVGLFQLALGALRMGTLVNFVSPSVLVGFTTGAAVLIVISQVKHFFGIEVARGASVWRVLTDLFLQFDQINPYVTGVAVITLAVSIALKRWRPRLPAMIIAMVVGSLVAALMNFLAGGVEHTGIKTIGTVNVGLPPLSRPDFSLATIETLVPIAIALALLALTEAVSIARSVALRSGQRIDGNQEFIGQGLSNVVGAFFSGYASSGSFNRSGLNYDSGAKTPLSAAFSAVFLLLIVLFLAPIAKFLPLPAMAGVLFIVAWGLVDVYDIRKILRVSRNETAVLLTTFGSTLTLNLEYAIYIGVLLSLLLFLNRTARPGMEDVKPFPGQFPPAFSSTTRLPDCPQMKIVRINGALFFGSTDFLKVALERIDERNSKHRHLLLVASGINEIDMAGAHLLAHEAKRRRALGGGLYIFHIKHEPLQMLRRSGAFEAIGANNFFALGDDVMGTLYQRLNADICQRCTVRIFAPCKTGADAPAKAPVIEIAEAAA